MTHKNPSSNSVNPTTVIQQAPPTQTKSNLITFALLTILISSVVSGLGGFFLGSKIQQTQKTSLVITPQNSTGNNLEKEPSTVQLPFPVVRTKAKVNYADWTLYKDKSGYSFYYPRSWFVGEGGNQVQSWNPNSSNSNPQLLGGDETKWDLYFGEKSFSSFEEALTQADSSIDRWDNLEVSSTTKGWPVYFAFKEFTVPMGPYLVAIIMTPENKTITLHGFSGDARSPNIEILKQIAESIQK